MELRLFSLVSYLASSAYLVSWLFRQMWALFLSGRTCWFKRKMAGKVLSLKPWSKSGNRFETILSLAGILFGCTFTLWLSGWIIKEWLLVILVVLAIVSEEFKTSQRETQLLAVIVLLDLLQTHSKPDEDFFEILPELVRDLPAGEVQKAVLEAIFRRRSGIAVEKSMGSLRGLDPFLDELILTQRLTGWENGPALNLILNRLLQRAGRKWDHTSRIMLLKDQARPFVRFGRAALISGLLVTLLSSSTVLAAAWPGETIVVWLGLVVLALGLLLYVALINHWVSRSLVVLIFFVALASETHTIKVQVPAWIQIQTVTHSSGSLSEEKEAIIQTVVDPVQTSTSQPVLSASTSFSTPTTTLVVTPAPTLSPTPTITLSVAIPTFSEMEVIEPCCHRYHQPR